MPELKLWNGRGYSCRNPQDPRWNGVRDVHAYICATSRADARRIVKAYTGRDRLSDHELKTYFAEGLWGNAMDGVTPERGLWLCFGQTPNKPVKVWGEGAEPLPAVTP